MFLKDMIVPISSLKQMLMGNNQQIILKLNSMLMRDMLALMKLAGEYLNIISWVTVTQFTV